MEEIIGYQNTSICNAILVRIINYWIKNGGKNGIFSAIWKLNVEQNYRITKKEVNAATKYTSNSAIDIYSFEYFSCPK